MSILCFNGTKSQSATTFCECRCYFTEHASLHPVHRKVYLSMLLVGKGHLSSFQCCYKGPSVLAVPIRTFYLNLLLLHMGIASLKSNVVYIRIGQT